MIDASFFKPVGSTGTAEPNVLLSVEGRAPWTLR
jgi:hypothetical protein